MRAGLFVALLTSTVGQRLAFKSVGYCLGPHPIFVLLSVSGAFVAIFGAGCAAIVATTGGFRPETRTWRCFAAFAAIGSCNGLQGAGMIFANPSVPGFMQVLLQQAAVPFTLAIARVACGAMFSTQQYTGVLFILAGIALELLPSATKQAHSLGSAGGLPAFDDAEVWWMLVFLLAQAPVAAAAVVQERVFSDVPVNVFHMMFWASLFQFLALLLLVPLGVPSLAGLSADLSSAWLLCWREPGAGGVLLSCVGLMLAAQLSQAPMVKHASAAFMVLCLALAVPASAVAFTMPSLMGSHTEGLRGTTLAALALVSGGIACYRLGEPLHEVGEAGQPLLLDDGILKRQLTPTRQFTPPICAPGAGLIQSGYTNAAHLQTPLWQENTLLDSEGTTRRGGVANDNDGFRSAARRATS